MKKQKYKHDHNQDLINEWYKTKHSVLWKRVNNAFELSGKDLHQKVTDDEWVLDVGCGANRYKGKIKNLTAFDPAAPGADIQCSIEDFKPDRLYDVAFCLSSINFGTEEIISNQIEKVVSCMKPESRIYWRLSPDHKVLRDDDGDIYLQFFSWTFEKLQKYADQYGYTQTAEAMESEKDGADLRPTRLYAEWHREQ